MYARKAANFRIKMEPHHAPVTNTNERLLKISKETHLRVKLVSYEKNRPEVFSATFSKPENSISVFFCQLQYCIYQLHTDSGHRIK